MEGWEGGLSFISIWLRCWSERLAVELDSPALNYSIEVLKVLKLTMVA
jgi:hypothetical protein